MLYIMMCYIFRFLSGKTRDQNITVGKEVGYNNKMILNFINFVNIKMEWPLGKFFRCRV